jgi:hypothetical protein
MMFSCEYMLMIMMLYDVVCELILIWMYMLIIMLSLQWSRFDVKYLVGELMKIYKDVWWNLCCWIWCLYEIMHDEELYNYDVKLLIVVVVLSCWRCIKLCCNIKLLSLHIESSCCIFSDGGLMPDRFLWP